jgi:hypothetical protein
MTEKDSNSKMNIYQKMSAVSNEIRFVKKDLNVPTSKTNSYSAVGEAGILDAVKPVEKKYGIYSFPVSREIVSSVELPTAKQYLADGTPYDKFSRFLRIKTVYRFVNLDDPKDFVDMTTFADGIDSGDKAPGKAETYCDKYALMKAYKIITGDDPDQFASVCEKADGNPVVPSNVKPSEAVPKKADEAAEDSVSVPEAEGSAITAETAAAMDELRIDPERLAAFLQKDVSSLTEADCAEAVKRKKARMAIKDFKKTAQEGVSKVTAEKAPEDKGEK